MPVINQSVEIVRNFAKEFRARGLKEATKPLGGFKSVSANMATGKELLGTNTPKPNDIIYAVERTAPREAGDVFPRVIARDTYVSSASGKPKLVFSQLMSRTGYASIYPAKKGFLGIGKKKSYFYVSQDADKANRHLDKTAKDMCLSAQGTLQEPVNPVLAVGDDVIVLTLEKAKQFINDVLKGVEVHVSEYKPF